MRYIFEFNDKDTPGHHAPVITTRVPEEKRVYQSQLLLCKPKQITHRKSPLHDMNYKAHNTGIPEINRS